MRGRKNPPRNRFGIPPKGPKPPGVPAVLHDRLNPEKLSGVLRLEVRTLTPLHVGTGAFTVTGGELAKDLLRRDGRPVVPGSSIKGICRQTYEALTNSPPPFGDFPKGRGRLASPAGSLFGALGLEGRLSFDDAVPAAEIEPVKIRLSVAYPPRKPLGRRFYGRMPAGALQPKTIPALAIPAGKTLETALHFRNLEHRDLGGVLMALGVDRFTPRLGGAKYDDYGWVRFGVIGFRLRGGFRFGESRWQGGEAEVAAFVERCAGAVSLTPEGGEVLKTLTDRLQSPANPQGDRR